TQVDVWHTAREELARLAPREVLVGTALPDAIAEWLRGPRGWAVAPLPDGGAGSSSPGDAAGRAAAGILAYLDATYRSRPRHRRPVEPYALDGVLQLDSATRRNLELLETLSGERRGSLLGVLDDTLTPMGARRLREWLLYPLLDAAAVGGRLDAVEEL